MEKRRRLTGVMSSQLKVFVKKNKVNSKQIEGTK